ncbi:MAG: hypothetical protein AB1705_00455 [Verrucomicrobiota bacterium]
MIGGRPFKLGPLIRFCLVWMPWALLQAGAANWYVAPQGTPGGPGTMAEPYDLRTALSGGVGQPGDTFWLREGTYALGQVATQVHGEAGKPITFRQWPGEKARVDGSVIFWGAAGHVVLRDFELYSSDTNRLSAIWGAGINPPPSDINPRIGIECYAPNLSFINLVVRDQTRSGIYISEVATNTLVYGCLLYNNGWASPDNAEGHNVYAQSYIGPVEIADNIAFNATGANFHLYEQRAGRQLAGVTLEGNVAFHAGALQQVRRYWDWIIGVEPPSTGADRIVLKENMTYRPLVTTALDNVLIGWFGTNGSVVLQDNYFPLSLTLNNWTNATVTGNLFAAQNTNPIVRLNQTFPMTGVWDDNRYWRAPTAGGFWSNSIVHTFPEWQAATSYDLNSSHTVGGLSGTQVFVRPNRFEPGRANIIVYNWDGLSHVPVDVASLLPVGVGYDVINAQDPSGPPVLSGVFDGAPLLLPMTGLTVAAPNGPLLTPPSTGPTFNVFVLLPRAARLQIATVAPNVEVSWPTNVGNWTLQSRASLAADGSWANDTNTPVIRGEQYVVTKPATGQAEFYRLRPQQ